MKHIEQFCGGINCPWGYNKIDFNYWIIYLWITFVLIWKNGVWNLICMLDWYQVYTSQILFVWSDIINLLPHFCMDQNFYMLFLKTNLISFNRSTYPSVKITLFVALIIIVLNFDIFLSKFLLKDIIFCFYDELESICTCLMNFRKLTAILVESLMIENYR